jgi:hypothetical protein
LVRSQKYTADIEGQTNFILSEQLREKANSVLEEIDFPTSRTDAWKYTRVAKIKNTKFSIKDSSPSHYD